MSEKILTPESLQEGTDLYDGFILSALEGDLDFGILDPETLFKIHERLMHYVEIRKSVDKPGEEPFAYLEAKGLTDKLGIDIDDESLAMIIGDCEAYM